MGDYADLLTAQKTPPKPHTPDSPLAGAAVRHTGTLVETNQPSFERTNEPSIDTSNDQTKHASNHTSTVRTNERTKLRHTFDIFRDQLLSLREIALARERTSGGRVLLGDLVQEALDTFITKQRKKE